MKRRVDLIDQFAELVVGADDPRRLAERTLEVVMSLTNGRAGAVFTRDDERITLFASRGIDQHVLDAIQTVWDRHRETFEKGETFYIPERDSDNRLPKRSSRLGPSSFAVVPVFNGEDLVALLYVDSLDPHFCSAHDLERMSKFSRIVAKAQSTRFGLSVSSGTNFASVAIRSLAALPLSRRPGWKMGVPGGSAFSLAST